MTDKVATEVAFFESTPLASNKNASVLLRNVNEITSRLDRPCILPGSVA